MAEWIGGSDTVLQSIPDGVIVTDRDGVVVYVNAAAIRLTGWPADAASGQPVDRILPLSSAAARDQAGTLVHRVLERGEPLEVERHYILTTRDGSTLPVGCIVGPMVEDDAVIGVIVLFWDGALHQGEQQHQAFLEASVDMAFIKDADFRYVMANARYAALFERTSAEIVGKTDFDLLPPEVAQACRNTDMHALREDRLVINDEMLDGRIYETRKFPIDLDRQTGVGAVIRDITEKTLAQQEIRRNESRLRSIVRIIQHPAGTVQGFLDYALAEALALTESALGYIYFYDEETQQFTLNTWSRGVLEACSIQNPKTVYDLEKTGIWGEAVRQRRPIVVNDFHAPHPLKRGYPEGHAPLSSFLTIPVFSEGEIVAVIGVANKPSDYTDGDVLQLTLLMDAVWKVIDRRRAEEALQQERDNLVAILEAVPVATMVFDQDLTVMMANSAADRLFHGANETVLGRRCGELLVCENHATAIAGCGHGADCPDCALFQALLAALGDPSSAAAEGDADAVLNGETQIVRQTRDPLWVSYRVNGLVFNGERRAVMSLDDITARRAAEEAVVAERRLLRAVIDNLPDTIYVKDTQGRKTLANRAEIESVGLETEDEVLGKSDFELYPDWIAARFWADDQKVLTTGEPVRDREEILTQQGGELRWFSTSKYPLRDQSGKIIGLVGTGRDITERKRAESERRELLVQVETQAQQVRHIIETVPQGVLLLSRDGRVLMTNPVADADLAVLARGSDNRLTHLGDRPFDALLAPPPHGLWHEVQAEDRVFEVLAQPVAELTSSEAWVMVINEVTEMRQVRDQLQQQERLAAVGQLAAGIAHDFNNIMAVIVLHAQLVSKSLALSERDQERLKIIHQQAHHATRLIEQILDFSRRSVLARQSLALYPFLNEQVKLLQRTLPEHIDIILTTDADPIEDDQRYVIDADPTRIQQLVMNLAINARDAMPDGGQLHLGLSRLSLSRGAEPPVPRLHPGDWVVLEVRDTGTGIAPEALEHMYEPFFTTKPPGQGSGLGLAQVHGIVGQHGGQIDLATTRGVGTTFTIYLPALSQPRAPDTAMLSDVAPEGRGQTVLIVEDSAPLRVALQEMISGWRYEAVGAADGKAALARIAAADPPIDLVLSDVVMPEMGGMALVRELRAQGQRLPVILMSGHPQDMGLDDLQALGVHAWLHKPPDLDELARTIAAALA
jgi:two-component system, cell cycle sensor histidine kinase and response regulator CckA